MKKVTLLLTFCLLIGIKGFSQFSFGVAPSLSTNSAYFGYKVGKFVPYAGFQLTSISINMEETGEEFDYDLMDVASYTDNIKASGNLYIPNIGVKYYAIEQNKLKAYFNLSIAKPIIKAKLESDGEANEDISDAVKKVQLLGGEFGFGVEYFFDDNFSIGGEFGLKYFGGNYSDTYTDDFYNENTGYYQDTEITNTYKIGLIPTYSKISLNFYFGAKNQ